MVKQEKIDKLIHKIMKTKLLKLWESFKDSKCIQFFIAIWAKLFHGNKIPLNVDDLSDYKEPKFNDFMKLPTRPFSLQCRRNNSLHPIIIEVVNHSNDKLNNVELFNAIENADTPYQAGQIEIKGTPWTSYTTLLKSLFSYKYGINMIRVFTMDGSQLDLTMHIIEKDVLGASQSIPKIISPTADSIHKSIVDVQCDFVMDCFTSIIIDELPANKTIKLYLYLSSIQS
jgi:hypothetical protein